VDAAGVSGPEVGDSVAGRRPELRNEVENGRYLENNLLKEDHEVKYIYTYTRTYTYAYRYTPTSIIIQNTEKETTI
jgi:hypothetical protein